MKPAELVQKNWKDLNWKEFWKQCLYRCILDISYQQYVCLLQLGQIIQCDVNIVSTCLN